MNHRSITATVVAFATAAVLTLSGCSNASPNDTSVSTSASATAPSTVIPQSHSDYVPGQMSEDDRAAMIAALTVSTTPASAKCETDMYGNVTTNIESLLDVPLRLWPDSIGTPFVATDPVAIRAELQKSICQDPNIGSAWLTFVATTIRDELLKSTGIDLLVLDPRLVAYTDVSQITPTATTFIPLLNVKSPTKAQIDNAVSKNAAWRQDAELVNTLLGRFAVLGIDSRQSVVNYHLTDYGFDADALPVIGVNDGQENLPALIFSLTEKGQCGEILTFGTNVGDKRPELFAVQGCAPTTTTTTPPTDTPKCPPNLPNGTPETGCKSSGGDEPSYQGHNKPNIGNGQAPVVTKPAEPAKAGDPPVIYTTAPAAPVSTDPPIGSTATVMPSPPLDESGGSGLN